MLILVNILTFKLNVGFSYNYFVSQFGILYTFKRPVKESVSKIFNFTLLKIF